MLVLVLVLAIRMDRRVKAGSVEDFWRPRRRSAILLGWGQVAGARRFGEGWEEERGMSGGVDSSGAADDLM